MDWLFQTDNSFSYVFLRFGLALTFFMHGTQHAFGWHGGKGPKAQVANWRDKYHIPAAMGVLALAIEFSRWFRSLLVSWSGRWRSAWRFLLPLRCF